MALTIKKDDCDLINKDPPITFPYKLDPFQKHAINSIESGNHVLVTAHTSAGKTRSLEMSKRYNLTVYKHRNPNNMNLRLNRLCNQTPRMFDHLGCQHNHLYIVL